MSATPEVQVQEITIMTLAEVAAAVRGVGGAETFAVEVSKAAQAAAELFDIALQGAMTATFGAIGNADNKIGTIAELVDAVKADAEANGTKAVGKTQLQKYAEGGRFFSLKGSWNPAGDTVETVKAARVRTLIEQAYNATKGITKVRAAIVGTQGEAVKALKALIDEAAAAPAVVAPAVVEADEAEEAEEAVSFDAAIFALKQAVDAAFAAMPEESTKEQMDDITTLVADIKLLAQQVGELSAVKV